MAKIRGGGYGWLTDGIVTGLVGAATTTATIAAYGKATLGDPWTPFNAISHLLFGEEAVQKDGFVPRETLIGLGLSGAALITWGVLYEALARKVPFPQSLLTGATGSAVIYALDYHIFPPKLRPGFEKRLGNDSVIATYLLLAIAFGSSPLWKKGDPR